MDDRILKIANEDSIIGSIALLALGSAAAAGAGVGWVTSKMGDPRESDFKNLRKEYLNMVQAASIQKRRQQLEQFKQQQQQQEAAPVTKKRDPFMGV